MIKVGNSIRLKWVKKQVIEYGQDIPQSYTSTRHQEEETQNRDRKRHIHESKNHPRPFYLVLSA